MQVKCKKFSGENLYVLDKWSLSLLFAHFNDPAWVGTLPAILWA